MKKTLFMALGGILLLLCGCERELPYGDPTRSVAFDIKKVTGSELLLGAGTTDGDFRINITIPARQGDFSFMKEARLMCVYTPSDATKSKQYVEVTTIPTASFTHDTKLPVTIDMAALCSRLGISSPALSDRMDFTIDMVGKDGTVVPGWNLYGGFNNVNFTNWSMADGTNLSYRVFYVAYVPLDKDKLQGTAVCDEEGSEYDVEVVQTTEAPATIPAGFEASDFICLVVYDIWDVDCIFKIWVNLKDYSLIMPNQVIHNDWGTASYPQYGRGQMMFNSNNGELDTENNIITFSTNAQWRVSAGTLGFGAVKYILTF